MTPTKTYPGGEAGQYLCTCSNCRQQFYGFKGDVICQTCSDAGDRNKETHDYKRAFENEYAQHKLDLDTLTAALAKITTLETRNRQLVQAMGEAVNDLEAMSVKPDLVQCALAMLKEKGKE